MLKWNINVKHLTYKRKLEQSARECNKIRLDHCIIVYFWLSRLTFAQSTNSYICDLITIYHNEEFPFKIIVPQWWFILSIQDFFYRRLTRLQSQYFLCCKLCKIWIRNLVFCLPTITIYCSILPETNLIWSKRPVTWGKSKVFAQCVDRRCQPDLESGISLSETASHKALLRVVFKI